VNIILGYDVTGEARRTHVSEYKYLKGLVGKPRVNRSFRSPRRREEHNIKTDLKEIGWEDMDWNHLV